MATSKFGSTILTITVPSLSKKKKERKKKNKQRSTILRCIIVKWFAAIEAFHNQFLEAHASMLTLYLDSGF